MLFQPFRWLYRLQSPGCAGMAAGRRVLAAVAEHRSHPELCGVKTNRGVGDVCRDPRQLVIWHL